ncbi:MAG: hypothetical protein COV35_04310 [Alphaproteobacteria bacterium CG11_big_fil_rev_8_21_14_0_20_39_49]|nr:MAG: hypothetical protein COV35_04310 [Alphaproteobacteria bacterium CG11_big_fil_rev_8_21_14_0_20_39_49]
MRISKSIFKLCLIAILANGIYNNAYGNEVTNTPYLHSSSDLGNDNIELSTGYLLYDFYNKNQNSNEIENLTLYKNPNTSSEKIGVISAENFIYIYNEKSEKKPLNSILIDYDTAVLPVNEKDGWLETQYGWVKPNTLYSYVSWKSYFDDPHSNMIQSYYNLPLYSNSTNNEATGYYTGSYDLYIKEIDKNNNRMLVLVDQNESFSKLCNGDIKINDIPEGNIGWIDYINEKGQAQVFIPYPKGC